MRERSTPGQVRYNLPLQFAPLIGREAQLNRLERLLFSYRWVTLVGEGGMGKTRLALAVAERVLNRFPDGVWLIPLVEGMPQMGPDFSPDEVRRQLVSKIGWVLGFTTQSSDLSDETLFEYLQDKKILLLLDSFDRLSPGADFVIELLTRAAHVHVLMTSRQLLHFQSGYIMHLDGLDAPEDDADPDALLYSGVQMFIERVERLPEKMGMTAGHIPAIARICRLLDGIPLAIELAASWALKKTPDEIAPFLQANLDFLATSTGGIEERHRRMHTVFEISWNLLTGGEKDLLARCACLPGAFNEEQVLAVSQGTAAELESLIGQSLIVRVSPDCCQMHETLRQFVLEKSNLTEAV